MTILVVGKATDKAKRCTCRNCGSILEYFPIDTYKETRTDYTGAKDTYTYLNCPTCSHNILVGGV